MTLRESWQGFNSRCVTLLTVSPDSGEREDVERSTGDFGSFELLSPLHPAQGENSYSASFVEVRYLIKYRAL
jgi:hypothetical protein